MVSITSTKMRVNNAEQFLESVSEPSYTVLYLTYGKVDAWANSAPDTPVITTQSELQLWSSMIGGKRIFGNDVSLVIPRYKWTANTTYYAYDDTATDLYNQRYYVVTSNFDVYKCLANGYTSNTMTAVASQEIITNSTVEPTAVNPGTITETSDGYVWKYLYSISDSDQMRFMTDSYIPIKKLTNDNGSLQWKVQQNAIEGAIYHIRVTSPGSGYSNSTNVIVTITGDGSSATARATVNATTARIDTITMTDYGSKYTYASVSISGDTGSGAKARAIISPVRGHGKDPIYELNASKVMLNPSLRFTEGDVLPAINEFRQIGILKDPLINNQTIVSTNAAFRQAWTVTTTGTGNYNQDEFVYQGSSLASSSFSGRVLSWDSANGIAILVNTTGAPGSTLSLNGVDTSTSRYVTKFIDEDLENYTGQVLYINNINPITRASDQSEEFKIVVKF